MEQKYEDVFVFSHLLTNFKYVQKELGLQYHCASSWNTSTWIDKSSLLSSVSWL